jgi:competence protein ComFC
MRLIGSFLFSSRGNHVFSPALKNAMGFIFPRLCVVCTEPLSGDPWLCDACIQKLIQNHSQRDGCPRCGQNRRIKRCTCEYNWQFPFDSIYSFFDFDEIVKSIAHEFKYADKKRLAYDMGKTYARFVPPSFFTGVDMIVAVPLFFLRKMKRGYNQADCFSKGIACALGKKAFFVPNILVRKRPTKTQTKLSRTMRQKNVQGAFMVPMRKRDMVRDKNIVIVDDIVTTAATTRECALALRAAGCGTIKVLSLARD